MSGPVSVQEAGEDEHACWRGGEGSLQDDVVCVDTNKSSDIYAEYGGDGPGRSG